MQNRRDALKLAAKSAVLIGTIPSGAVFANSSAHQCMDNINGTEVEVIKTDEDEFIRVKSIKRITKHHGTYFKVLDKWYLPNGNEYTEKVKKGEEEEVYVAISFYPNQDMNDIRKIKVRFDYMEADATALTGSCWASVSPDTKMELS